MRIESIRIQNYRSIPDSGELRFEPGFNLIVGANSVGKSSLLSCLAGKFGGEPHKSIAVLPNRDDPLDKTSTVSLSVVASGAEIRRRLLAQFNGHHYLPWPADMPCEQSRAAAVLSRLLDAPGVKFRLTPRATEGSASPNEWAIADYPATRLYTPQIDGGHYRMLRFDVHVVSASFGGLFADLNGSPGNDVGVGLGRVFLSKVYLFHAERLSLGVGLYGTNTELASDARNLSEVLNILQGNPEQFVEYCAFVREVFPPIQWISVRPSPSGGNQVEILVWQVDPRLKREDLAMPLARCGTGIGQVLAILYVAVTSEQARTIIIDEPGSFLHPGAARALVGILKSFPQHQYIIATHSPEIIAELSQAPVTIIRWADSKSLIEQAPSATGEAASAALAEVGARLSDVFGFDKVLWVEGQSDADAFKQLLQAVGRPQRRVGILPVRDTGAFTRRKIAEVIGIYRSLSMGGALLPPAVLFLFDRDGRSEIEQADAIRESGGQIRFLGRRMLESYLIHSGAIADLFNEVGHEYGLQTDTETVSAWIMQQGAEFVEAKGGPEVFSPPWLATVDGAKLIATLFEELSGNRLEYRKVVHTPRLAVILHQVDPEAAGQLLDLVRDVVE
jgi:energy-coupling factor transporter ATP-binding protein EcfA2